MGNGELAQEDRQPTGEQMDQAKLRTIKVMLTAMKGSINGIGEKSKHISIATAEQFNEILKVVKEAFPDMESILPKPITANSPFARMGVADETYDGLAMKVDMIIALVSENLSEK